MAYNLTMQINLQAPSAFDVDRIRRQLESSLSGLNMSISTKGLSQTNSQIKTLTGNMRDATDSAEKLAEIVGKKFVTFSAYAVASTIVLKLADAFSTAFNEAVKFEAEMLKIAQITNKSTEETLAHSEALFEISKRYNVSVSKIAQLTGTLAQTGLSFRDAAKGAELLARTSLLSTFDSLTNTTEGLIAIINTFELSMDNAGLALEAMNTVSKKYAVESSDLVDVVRRTGGAFRAAGGDVNELFALFTSVRQTTRESAETIATGMRTIFARIQRPETIQYFKDLGIELASIDGKLVGPFEAIQRISNGLRNLGITAGDVRFSEIIEEIGGIRQISKVIPLLTQTKLQTEALATAQNGLAESSEDIRKAQEGFGYQLGVLQKNFQELVHEIVSSSDFKFFLKNVLDLTNGLITLGRTLTDLIPLMGLVFGAQSLGVGFQFARRLSSGAFNPLKYAGGGFVPGRGDGDTVPAMLTPGEFVINKKSAQMFGYGNLKKINKYAKGGVVQHFASGGEVGGFSGVGQDLFKAMTDAIGPVVLQFARLYLQTQLYTSVLSGIMNATKSAAKATQSQVDKIKEESKERNNLKSEFNKLGQDIIDLEKSIENSQISIYGSNDKSRALATTRATNAALNTVALGQINGINQQSAPLTGREQKRFNRAVNSIEKDFGKNSREYQDLAQTLKIVGNDQRSQHDAVVAYVQEIRKSTTRLKKQNALPESNFIGPLTPQQIAKQNINKAGLSIAAKESGRNDIQKLLNNKSPKESLDIRAGRSIDWLSQSNALTNSLMMASTALSSYFVSAVMKSAEAAQKLTDEAIKQGNAQEADRKSVESVSERQRSQGMATGASVSAAAGFLLLGPLGAAIGGLIGAFLGFSGVVTSITDALGLTNSELEKQEARRRAIAEAEINALDKSTGKINNRASILSKTDTAAATSEFAKGVINIDALVRAGQLSYSNSSENGDDVQQRLKTQFDLMQSEFEKLSQLPKNAGKGFNELSKEIPGFSKALDLIKKNMTDGAIAVEQFKSSIEAADRAREISVAKEKNDKIKSALDQIIKHQETIFKNARDRINNNIEDRNRDTDIASRIGVLDKDQSLSATTKILEDALAQTRANREVLFGGLGDSIATSEQERQGLARRARQIPAVAGEEQNIAQVNLEAATNRQISMIETQIRLEQEELSIQEKLVGQMTSRVDKEIETTNAITSFKKNLLEQFAIGSISDRNRLGATSAFAKSALSTGDLSRVPQELKSSVIELLKGIGQEKEAILIQAREIQKGSGGRISFEQAKKGLEGRANPTEALKNAVNAQTEAIKEQRAIQDRIAQEELTKANLELENMMNFRDAIKIFREAVDILAGNRQMPLAANGPAQQMEVAAVQDVTVNIPGMQNLVSAEVSKATYKAIADKFNEMANKIDGVTNPQGIAQSFREAAV